MNQIKLTNTFTTIEGLFHLPNYYNNSTEVWDEPTLCFETKQEYQPLSIGTILEHNEKGYKVRVLDNALHVPMHRVRYTVEVLESIPMNYLVTGSVWNIKE